LRREEQGQHIIGREVMSVFARRVVLERQAGDSGGERAAYSCIGYCLQLKEEPWQFG
jgi:hypothetical protein